MSKAIKNKKDKVPKITEEEYARYISSLKAAGDLAQENAENTPLGVIQGETVKDNEKRL